MELAFGRIRILLRGSDESCSYRGAPIPTPELSLTERLSSWAAGFPLKTWGLAQTATVALSAVALPCPGSLYTSVVHGTLIELAENRKGCETEATPKSPGSAGVWSRTPKERLIRSLPTSIKACASLLLNPGTLAAPSWALYRALASCTKSVCLAKKSLPSAPSWQFPRSARTSFSQVLGEEMWWFPEQGPLFGGPYNKDHNILGLILGPLLIESICEAIYTVHRDPVQKERVPFGSFQKSGALI